MFVNTVLAANHLGEIQKSQSEAEENASLKSIVERCGDAKGIESVILEKKKELDQKGMFDQRNTWSQPKGSHPDPLNFLISSPFYLGAWGVTTGMGIGLVPKYHKDEFDPLIGTYFATGTTLLAIVDGLTFLGGLKRCLWKADELQAALNDLANAYRKDGTENSAQLQQAKERCVKQIHTSLSLMGGAEAATQGITDAFSAVHTTMQWFAQCVLVPDVLITAEKFASVNQIALSNAKNGAELVAAWKDVPHEQKITLQPLFDEQKENFDIGGIFSTVGLGVGIGINVVGITRAILELVRFSETRGVLYEQKERLKRAWHQIKKTVKEEAGIEVIGRILQAWKHKIASNTAALVGGTARLFSGIAGIIIKAFALAGAAANPAGAVIGAVTMLTFFIKNLVQGHHDRKARQKESEVTNTFEIGKNVGLADGIDKELAADLEKLVNKDNYEGFKQFLTALGQPAPSDQAFVEMGQAGRLTFLQSALESSLAPSEARLHEQMRKSENAILQLEAKTIELAAKDRKAIDASQAHKPVEKSEVDRKSPAETTWLKRLLGNIGDFFVTLPGAIGTLFSDIYRWLRDIALFGIHLETWKKRFLRNSLEKVIGALSGSYPGWHMNMGKHTGLENEARLYLEKRCKPAEGKDKATIDALIQVGIYLAHNNELVRQKSPFHALFKAKTWALSAKGNNLTVAFKAGDLGLLSAKTLASALNDRNHEFIAQCRFEEDSAKKQQLSERLKEVTENHARVQLKAMSEALATANGKQLKDAILQLTKGRRDAQIAIDTLKAAIMLNGDPLDRLSNACGILINACRSELSSKDIGAMLALLSGKQLHANIEHHELRRLLKEMVSNEGEVSGRTIFIKEQKMDARWDLYARDISQGKCSVEDAPTWLLQRKVKDFLKGMKLSNACEPALKEQIQNGLDSTRTAFPISLLWPAEFFKRKHTADNQPISNMLAESFVQTLHIDPYGRGSEGIWIEAAKTYADWDAKTPSMKEIYAMIKKGYQRMGTSDLQLRMASKLVLSGNNFALSNDSIQILAETSNFNEFEETLARIVMFHRHADPSTPPDARTLASALDKTNAGAIAHKIFSFSDESNLQTLKDLLSKVADTQSQKHLIAMTHALATANKKQLKLAVQTWIKEHPRHRLGTDILTAALMLQGKSSVEAETHSKKLWSACETQSPLTIANQMELLALAKPQAISVPKSKSGMEVPILPKVERLDTMATAYENDLNKTIKQDFLMIKSGYFNNQFQDEITVQHILIDESLDTENNAIESKDFIEDKIRSTPNEFSMLRMGKGKKGQKVKVSVNSPEIDIFKSPSREHALRV